ncbi:MAG TPA: hypothetical protein DCG33_04950 [Prevotellaceae bacterium]|jgi:hypothetical protein|nr:hypothetical protein [Prevotellaceae bacterium]
MKRRDFLGSILALSAQGLMLKAATPNPQEMKMDMPRLASRKKAKFDDNLVVFISDLHTRDSGPEPIRQRRAFEDILKMNPLPRNIIALGDLAHLYGYKENYLLLKENIKRIEDAGINLTLGLGNHDRRENYSEVFPQYAARTLVPGNMVFKVETPHADFIILDSLNETEDTHKWNDAGIISDAQTKWLTEEVKNYKKPFFVCLHHPIKDAVNLKMRMLMDSPCCGYIYGHLHRWIDDWVRREFHNTRIIPTLCVPSLSNWGDIGYVVMRLHEDHAEAELKEYEFFFPPKDPGIKPVDHKPLWDYIAADHNGQKYHFVYEP